MCSHKLSGTTRSGLESERVGQAFQNYQANKKRHVGANVSFYLLM